MRKFGTVIAVKEWQEQRNAFDKKKKTILRFFKVVNGTMSEKVGECKTSLKHVHFILM